MFNVNCVDAHQMPPSVSYDLALRSLPMTILLGARHKWVIEMNVITKTCLYKVDPLKPQFYIVKLGFTGVYIIGLISAQKHRSWVLVRTASARRF